VKYIFINQDGTVLKEASKEPSLKEMQEFVGGYIEYHQNIICNEDGLRLKLKRNIHDARFVGNIIETRRGK